MFEGLSAYLDEFYHATKTNLKCAGVINAIAASENDQDVDTSSNNSLTSSQPPIVELVSLLIEASGYVRERSQYTQYLNFCYTVKKECKRIAVEVHPRKSQRNS